MVERYVDIVEVASSILAMPTKKNFMLNNILKIKNFLPDFLYNFFRNVYHIFRFYNLIRPNYGVKDDIIFGR